MSLTQWLWTAAGVALLVTALTFLFTPPMPQRTVVMATGPEGGAYAALGQKYKEILSRQNVRLELLATNGSVENIERLRNSQGGVSVAFVQGGTTSGAEAPELVSLGTLFYEPFWVFSRVRPQNLPGGQDPGGHAGLVRPGRQRDREDRTRAGSGHGPRPQPNRGARTQSSRRR